MAHLKLRVEFDGGGMIGPGKADLMEGIAATGSIAAAGRAMGMSYKRAWTLVDTLNGLFAAPLVLSTRGGATGGSATLTATGRAVLAAYRQLQADAARAGQTGLARLDALRIDPAPDDGGKPA